MNDMIANQEAQLQQRDHDQELFHEIFRNGLLKTNEDGNISVVKSEKEQQRIAQGFIESSQGVMGSKSKEQVDFENVQIGRNKSNNK